MTIKVLAIPQDTYGCGQFRLIQPYRELKKTFPSDKYTFDVIMPEKHQGIPLEYLKNFDVFVMQRICTKPQMDVLLKLKELGKKIIMDVDDDLSLVSEDNDFYKVMNHTKKTTGLDYLKIFENACRTVDYITVTTPELEANLRKYYKGKLKIKVIPNAIDLKHPLIDPKNSRRNHLPLDRLVIGWQGGSSHTHDLEIIKNIQIILEKNPHVIFAFCSHNSLYQNVYSHLSRANKEQVIFIPPETIFDRYVSIPSMFDIGIAPLENTKFNDAKSWLKCLEYGIFKVPVIASPIPDYKRFANDSKNGAVIINSNKSSDFFKEIQKLIDNPDKRQRIGQKAYEYIQKTANIQNYNKLRIAILDEICGK